MNPARYPRLLPLGDMAWIVEFGGSIDAVTHALVMGLAQALADGRVCGRWPGVVEWVPAYTSLTVHFANDAADDAAGTLLALAREVAPLSRPGRRWRLPVCFDAEFAPDLDALAEARGLAPQQAVALMTGRAAPRRRGALDGHRSRHLRRHRTGRRRHAAARDLARGCRGMNGALEFVEAGAAVSIQDLGRSGCRAIGVPLAGAADPLVLACANALLAQDANLAALEVALLGPSLRASGAALGLALVGDFRPRLTRADGSVLSLSSWRSLTLQPGEQLTLGPCRRGIGYVALVDGVDVPLLLGSRSTYARAGLRASTASRRAPATGWLAAPARVRSCRPRGPSCMPTGRCVCCRARSASTSTTRPGRCSWAATGASRAKPTAWACACKARGCATAPAAAPTSSPKTRYPARCRCPLPASRSGSESMRRPRRLRQDRQRHRRRPAAPGARAPRQRAALRCGDARRGAGRAP